MTTGTAGKGPWDDAWESVAGTSERRLRARAAERRVGGSDRGDDEQRAASSRRAHVRQQRGRVDGDRETGRQRADLLRAASHPGVTCPVVSNGWQAGGGDGFLRTTVATTVGLLSTTTVDWTSPSFTVAAPDLASVGFELRGAGGSLLNLGRATVGADLVDLAASTAAPLTSPAAPPVSSAFVGAGGGVSPRCCRPAAATRSASG